MSRARAYRRNTILLWIVGLILFFAYAFARGANLHHDAHGLRWVYQIIFFALVSVILYAWNRKGSK
jgi:hypothetical protein